MRLGALLAVGVMCTPLVARAQEDVASAAGAAPEPAPVATSGGSAPAPPSSGTPTPPAPEPIEIAVVGRHRASRDRSADTSLIEGQRLRDSPRPSTFEAIAQQSADVYVPGRGALHGVAGGGTGGIRVRGLGGSPNSQVLVVEDGVPDYQGIFGHPIPDAYVPFLIDDVLVVKGGDSTLYGTNAMGGVVVIRNRWREEDGQELMSDSAVGSYATVRETVSGLARVGAWDLAGGVHAMRTDGHRDGAGGDQLIGSAAARYRFTPHLTLTARHKVVHLDGADPGPVTHPTPEHWYDVWRDTASLRLDWRRGRLRLGMTPYLNVGVHELFDGFRSVDHVGGGVAEAEVRAGSITDFLIGTAWQEVGGRVDNRITGERPSVSGMTDVSAYGQVDVRPVERVSLVVGARELLSSSHGAVLLYKGGARWSPFDGLALHTRVSRNFRQPTIRELYLPYPTANPDLRAERSLNWDAGAGHVSEHLELSGSGYRTEATDLIRYFGSWPTAEVVNVDHVVIWGVEGSVGLKRLGPASLFVTGNWQDVGRYTRQNPEAKLDFTLEVGDDLGVGFLGGSVSGEWVHGLYMGDYSRQPIDDVFAMDLSLRYRHESLERGTSLEPYLLVRNLLDRRYAYVEGYPMPGLNALIGLRIGV
ncbi:MAG TPA: TonB-dependent receptor [Polyangiaceae bacterium]|nr:TonB-dependent receptor [Polyangiaceae bacterium]